MIAEKFLNSERTQELWGKIKTLLSGKQDSLTPDETIVMQNGGISVATPIKGVTQAEYDGLTDEQKQENALYVVDEPDWTPVPLSIQEYDTDDGWHVRKWSDGYVELTANKGMSGITWGNITSGVRYSTFGSIPLPFSLSKKYSISPSVYVNVEQNQAVNAIPKGDHSNLLDDLGEFWLISFSTPPPSSIYLIVKITGRWK